MWTVIAIVTDLLSDLLSVFLRPGADHSGPGSWT